MNRLAENLVFSFFVSLVMVMLDALYHLATETAVHINYAAVKFIVIFLVVFLVANWVGKSITDGIFTSVSGPVIFYVYYVFANSTLNRALFKIDENFGYIFIHIAALLIAYFVIYETWALKKGSEFARSLSFAFVIALCIYGLDAGFQLSLVQFTTHDEEQTARTLNFKTSVYLVGLFFAISFLSNFFIKSKYVEIAALVAGSALAVYFMSHNILRSFVGIVDSALPIVIAKFYIKQK